MSKRIDTAKSILESQHISKTIYLGSGHEGVVFRDNNYVYKVIIPLQFESFNFEKAYRRKSYFLNLPTNTKHLYNIDLIRAKETFIVKYNYEEGEICSNYHEDEAISILTELWILKIIIMDCKPENCIRVGNTIKIIDLDGKDYTDNLFLNMCARMYLYINYYAKYEYSHFQKVKRSAINNFTLSELKGLREFVNKVFANIILEQSKDKVSFNLTTSSKESIKYSEKLNFEKSFYLGLKKGKYLTNVSFEDVNLNEHNYFEPSSFFVNYEKIKPLQEKVSLLIKTCPQDVQTVEENIKHIVKQLISPNPFYEIVVLIDPRENNFLREYYSKGSVQLLIDKIQKLHLNNVIDRYIVFDNEQSLSINKQWFDLSCKRSHTSKNAPVSPQLWAFNQCKGDFILQMDVDVMIGRKNYKHSFLKDMLNEFYKNKEVLSVGFNILNKESNDYFGFKNGGFVPEVRMGLLHKKRINSLLPLPNSIDDNGNLEFTWHRSLLKKQKESKKCSIRGGNHESFYIHPQNYRKNKPYAWMFILDRVEQNKVPEIQYGAFDCEGSLYDWSIPKRNEKLVVVSCFRNVSYNRFLRMWYSLMSQSYNDFGLILLDDNSDNGLPYLIDSLIKPYKERITFIKKRTKSTRLENVYRSIHYYMDNPESIIVMLDGDDALIGNETLQNLIYKYDNYNADVVVGRFHQTYRLQPHYRYPVDFNNPRKKGGNVWQHLKTFKKYLFDSIPLTHFKYEDKEKKLYQNNWFETCDDFALMVPIVEMSKQPLQLNEVNYFYERDYDKKDEDRDLKESCIAEILNKPSLSPVIAFKGRKTFEPNQNKIEIDITYDCNLKCIGCNRSCTQAPTTESVSVLDIEKFINDSISLNKKWELINVLGGEPTLHPNFEKIIELIHENYIEKFSPNTILQVVSNGVEAKSRDLCEKVKSFKNVRIDYGSFKESKNVEYFSPFNDAPFDDEDYDNSDYDKGCWVTSYCGIGLNKRGYYACSIIGGIDRLKEGKNAISSLSEVSKEDLKNQLEEFCKYCGNFKAYNQNAGDFIPRIEKEPFKNIVTKYWKDIYKKANQ
ncbi:glycosyltransferase [uncultured Lutibacter sp.]|uniref:glycosyltransferase n=1 Tax=uncultured Lutibacter sp. TaxID=437739 RepID=UPI00261A9DEA|nr:glycosyltransferase [uncultured Lutibacter sp.]